MEKEGKGKPRRKRSGPGEAGTSAENSYLSKDRDGEPEVVVRYVAGVDEVGRGPLAGPVVTCAVAICGRVVRPAGVRDSKKLTAKQRDRLYDLLIATPGLEYRIGSCSPAEIDTLNIYHATHLGMDRAVRALPVRPVHVFVDGNAVPKSLVEAGYAVEAVVNGDETHWVIAAASVIAKVTRDRIMESYARQPAYAMYGLDKHKGYPTKDHVKALRLHGLSDIHRHSFAPCKALVLSAATPTTAC